MRNNVRSHDPAEALLHLLLLRLYEADPGYVNQPDLPPEVALAALGQVLSEAAGKPVEDAPPQVQHVLLASGRFSWFRLVVEWCEFDPPCPRGRGGSS